MGIAKMAILGDATAGGKTKDTITLPVAATGAKTWPTTSFTYDDNEQPIELNDEMGYGRQSLPDMAFKHAPTVTASGVLYLPIAKSLAYQAQGVANTSGTATSGYTNDITPVADNVFYLPASTIHFQLEDEATPRVAVGCELDELEWKFDDQGRGTWTATWKANYIVEASATAIPAVDFSYLGTQKWPIAGRDGKVFEAGSGTASTGVKEFSIKWGPLTEDVDYDWSANVEDRTLDGEVSRLWFPTAGPRLKGVRDVTGSITFRGLDTTRNMRAVLKRARQLRVDFAGRDIAGTTGPVKELLRVNLAKAQFTEISRQAITRDAKIDSTYAWKATAPASGADVTVTVLDGLAGPVSVTN